MSFLGWAPFTVNTNGNISRYSVVDFLPIMGNPKMAIFIPRGEAVEEIDWKLYFTPFISDLWQMLLGSSVIFAMSLYLLEYIKLGKRPVCIISKYIPVISTTWNGYCFYLFLGLQIITEKFLVIF